MMHRNSKVQHVGPIPRVSSQDGQVGVSCCVTNGRPHAWSDSILGSDLAVAGRDTESQSRQGREERRWAGEGGRSLRQASKQRRPTKAVLVGGGRCQRMCDDDISGSLGPAQSKGETRLMCLISFFF